MVTPLAGGGRQVDEPRLLAQPREGIPEVIDTLEGFHAMCERFAEAQGAVAADAERASGFRYGNEDWLVQFKRQGAGIALVDPVALGRQGGDWQEFNAAVGDAEWIIHDSLEDLPGFAELGMRPQALFDSELAARMLGMAHFGLSAVTGRALGLTLAKEHSAADWSYRPLPRDWRNYAALDVELLIELEARLGAALKAQGKDEWARQEFAWLLRRGLTPRPAHSDPWRHLSHITMLRNDRRGLAVAQELWTVRDELARQYDIAPSLLLPDMAIVEAARRKPGNAREFRAIRSLNERVRVHMGGEQDHMYERYAPIQRQVKPSTWRQAIRRALELPADQLPPAEPPADGSGRGEGHAPRSMRWWERRHPDRFVRLCAARQAIRQIADDTRTPPEVVLKPGILRALCWREDAGDVDVAGFLAAQGARPWQVALVSASLTRAIISSSGRPTR